MRRLLTSRRLWFVVLSIWLLLFALSQLGRYLANPVDAAAKADLIVVLGGDAGARIEEAQRLYAAGYAPRVLLTGMEDGTDATRPYYLNWRAAFLQDRGVKRELILYDAHSRNTWEEAVNTRRLMERNGWRSVLVVSDPPHMRRLSWVWRRVFSGSSLAYFLVAAPIRGWDEAHWWRNEVAGQYVLKELVKLGYYHVVY